jgi:hypothetical protein
MNPVIGFLGSSTIICAGGACNSVYISVITSFFGAFGIAIAELLPYLDGLVILLILFTLYSLYIKKKSCLYFPYLIGCIGSVELIAHMFFYKKEKWLLYSGNFLIILAAFWNSRLNKPKSVLE